jgi:hypothetical protein
MKKQVIHQLPTLSKILELDSFDITRDQLHQCVAVALACGVESAKYHARKFENINALNCKSKL